MTRDELKKHVDDLIREGSTVLTTFRRVYQHDNSYDEELDAQSYSRWNSRCKNLMRLLGDKLAQPWKSYFEEHETKYYGPKRMGALQGIAQALNENLLGQLEDLIYAETFNNLLEQSEHLLNKGFFLAAGALGRAVVEEHMRNWCYRQNITIAESRPTLSDYYMALYKNGEYTVTVMKHVEAMAGIGNDAAHNKPNANKDDVKRFLRDLREFMAKHC